MRRSRRLALCCLAAVLVAVLGAAGAAAPQQPFSDVSGQEYYADAALWLHTAGIFRGVDPDRPQLGAAQPFSRAEMAAVLARMVDQESDAGARAAAATRWHDDGAIPSWARGYLALASERGWIAGYPDGSVRPGEPLSWAQVSILLARVTGNAHFASGSWPVSAMVAGELLGLYDELPHSFKPGDPVSRGEMVAAVWAAMQAGTDQHDPQADNRSLLMKHYAHVEQALIGEPQAGIPRDDVSLWAELVDFKLIQDELVFLTLGHGGGETTFITAPGNDWYGALTPLPGMVLGARVDGGVVTQLVQHVPAPAAAGEAATYFAGERALGTLSGELVRFAASGNAARLTLRGAAGGLLEVSFSGDVKTFALADAQLGTVVASGRDLLDVSEGETLQVFYGTDEDGRAVGQLLVLAGST